LELLPGRNFGQVFFTMCGSTAVDTAMKIALAYHRANGEAGRVRFVGRERGYHGVGFGGKAVRSIKELKLRQQTCLLFPKSLSIYSLAIYRETVEDFPLSTS
jgi:adenosylmethionine-8-amino-7-oxononanoate aminotransferase